MTNNRKIILACVYTILAGCSDNSFNICTQDFSQNVKSSIFVNRDVTLSAYPNKSSMIKFEGCDKIFFMGSDSSPSKEAIFVKSEKVNNVIYYRARISGRVTYLASIKQPVIDVTDFRDIHEINMPDHL